VTFFNVLQRKSVRPTRTSRKLSLAVEGCESRQLMSGATISGTTFQDLAGNGAFTDVSRLPCVNVNLYQKGSSTVLEHVSSDKNGNFSFTNLAPGSYSVQQVVPKSFLPTAALNGYPVTLAKGQTVSGNDFEDFQLEPLPVLGNLSYIVTTPGGKSSTFSSLNGHVQQGDTVTAKFKLCMPETITLVAYTAPNGDFNTSNLQQQVIFSQATAKGSGSESLKVTVPDGYFQIDFVAGLAIDHLATNPNVLYHAQDRFIDGQQGGTQPDAPSVKSSAVTQTNPSNTLLSMAAMPVSLIVTDTADSTAPGNTQRKH
jgi:SdrD B-like domain